MEQRNCGCIGQVGSGVTIATSATGSDANLSKLHCGVNEMSSIPLN